MFNAVKEFRCVKKNRGIPGISTSPISDRTTNPQNEEDSINLTYWSFSEDQQYYPWYSPHDVPAKGLMKSDRNCTIFFRGPRVGGVAYPHEEPGHGPRHPAGEPATGRGYDD
jgi:hypothetical protein